MRRLKFGAVETALAVRLPSHSVTIRRDTAFRVLEQSFELVLAGRLSCFEFVFSFFDFEPLRDKFVRFSRQNDVSVVASTYSFQK